jgi:hypothetical protein
VAVTDLAAHQQGNGVQLIFTLPGRAVSGDRLVEPPAVEIFRGALKPTGAPDSKSFKAVYMIPGALAGNYMDQGKIQFTDPLPPADLRANPGATYAYRVRTRASQKKDSADSNTVLVKAYPVADKIGAVEARVTQNAIELSWTAPAFASTVSGGESLAGYRVYRGELDSPLSASSPTDLSQVKWKSPPILLAPAPGSLYSDNLFEFDRTYAYFVRSVVMADNSPVESDDSTPVVVTPHDTFPPAAPQNIVLAQTPGENNSVVADLSWSINLESDLAGYRVYRSETSGQRGQLLTPSLLPSPAFRDPSILPGHPYFYVVTAVDRAGNESLASEEASLEPSQP